MEALIDDLVEQILLRLPPDDPASLLRTSLVCKGWCRLVCSPRFRRRFREFHRTPPMLGFLCTYLGPEDVYHHGDDKTRFVPTTSLRRLPHWGAVYRNSRCHAIGAVHGRILFFKYESQPLGELDFLVSSPMISGGDVRRLPKLVVPRHQLLQPARTAGLLCAAAGGCVADGSCPFGVVILAIDYPSTGVTFAYVYSSEEDAWTMQTSVQHDELAGNTWISQTTRVGDKALYFHCTNNRFCLEYNMSKQQKLSVISLPPEWAERAEWFEHERMTVVMAREDGALGVAAMYRRRTLRMLSRETGKDGQVRWGNQRVVDLSKFVPTGPGIDITIEAAVDDVPGVLLIGIDQISLFSVDIESGRVKKLWEGNEDLLVDDIVPYSSFYTPSTHLPSF